MKKTPAATGKYFFGKSERFFKPKKGTGASMTTPGVGKYEMMAFWSGKTEGIKKEKPKNYFNHISTGRVESVYNN